jgi:hypothetical protein
LSQTGTTTKNTIEILYYFLTIISGKEIAAKSRLYVHAFSLSRSYFQVFEELVIQKYKVKLPKRENYFTSVESSTDVPYLKIEHDGAQKHVAYVLTNESRSQRGLNIL